MNMSHNELVTPWAAADKRRRSHHVLLRLTEEQKLQLDYIAAHTSVRSAHDWILRRIAPMLNDEATDCWDAVNLELLRLAVTKAVNESAEVQALLKNRDAGK